MGVHRSLGTGSLLPSLAAAALWLGGCGSGGELANAPATGPTTAGGAAAPSTPATGERDNAQRAKHEAATGRSRKDLSSGEASTDSASGGVGTKVSGDAAAHTSPESDSDKAPTQSNSAGVTADATASNGGSGHGGHHGGSPPLKHTDETGAAVPGSVPAGASGGTAPPSQTDATGAAG